MFFSSPQTPQKYNVAKYKLGEEVVTQPPPPDVTIDYSIDYSSDYSSSENSYDDDNDVPLTMDEEEYAKNYGTQINCGINYSLDTHTISKKGHKKDKVSQIYVQSLVERVRILHRVRVSPKELIFKDPNGHWFIIELQLYAKFSAPYWTIIYNFSNNYYFSVNKTMVVQVNGDFLGYEIIKQPNEKVKQMDLLDWLLVRKAIYLEKFPDKSNIKDVFDPAILSLSNLNPDQGATLAELSNIKEQNSGYDLIDLDD